jgi:hypothetical protein
MKRTRMVILAEREAGDNEQRHKCEVRVGKPFEYLWETNRNTTLGIGCGRDRHNSPFKVLEIWLQRN